MTYLWQKFLHNGKDFGINLDSLKLDVMQAVLFASKGQKIITDASYKPSKQIAQ